MRIPNKGVVVDSAVVVVWEKVDMFFHSLMVLTAGMAESLTHLEMFQLRLTSTRCRVT